MIRTAIAALLYAPAVFIFFTEILGLFRFKYVLNRMHAAALGDTLGIMLIVAGTVVLRGASLDSVKLLLVPVFMCLTGPVVTHLIAGGELNTNPDAKKEFKREDRR